MSKTISPLQTRFDYEVLLDIMMNRHLCPNCFEKLVTLQLSKDPTTPIVQVYCSHCPNEICRNGQTAENFDAASQLLDKEFEKWQQGEKLKSRVTYELDNSRSYGDPDVDGNDV